MGLRLLLNMSEGPHVLMHSHVKGLLYVSCMRNIPFRVFASMHAWTCFVQCCSHGATLESA